LCLNDRYGIPEARTQDIGDVTIPKPLELFQGAVTTGGERCQAALVNSHQANHVLHIHPQLIHQGSFSLY